ncbi:uncharacterized protein METZ01_LOCUS155790, partial [marine metagenome]
FAQADITETGCSLGTFGTTSTTIYTDTCTASSDGTPTVLVAAQMFNDASGNDNSVSNTYTWTYDSTSPTMTITSDTVSSGATTATAAIALTFTSSTATTDFDADDITETGCSLGTFGTTSSTVYTDTCTASSDGTPTIAVAAGAFNDAVGNDNSASNTYTWTYDSTGPTVTISSTASDPSNGATIDVTIAFSESVSDFVLADITVSGGSATLSGSGSSYTATITPTADGTITVDVAAGVASDASGNANTAATQFSIVSDQNDAPAFSSTAVTTGTEDAAYSYTVTATDADDGDPNSNTVTLTGTTVPSWLTFTASTGVLAGTPGDSDIGANSVVITASDGTDSTTQSFTITVSNVNDVGSVAISGTLAEDSVLTATVTDGDGTDTITYSWESSSNLASWTSIGTNSNQYTLTQSEVGKYIKASVSYTDDEGTLETHSAYATTSGALATISNVDDDNTAVPTFSGTTTEDSVLTADYSPLSGNDEDGTTDADASSGAGYSYQWHRCTSTTASTCSDISSATSSTYTLTQDDVGNYIRVAVSYTDDYSSAETVNSAINSNAIANMEDVAVISGASTGAITEDASPNTVTGTPTVTDEDSGENTLTDVSSTASASGYGTYAVSSGTWTYTLDNSDSTVNALDSDSTAITDTFVVTSADGNTQATITVTISGANDAPTISSSAVTTATEDTAYTYTVTAADVDSGETLTMTGTTVPSWATFTASTGVLAGTPLNADVGDNSVVITVSDGTASVTDTFTIAVSNTNDAPT